MLARFLTLAAFSSVASAHHISTLHSPALVPSQEAVVEPRCETQTYPDFKKWSERKYAEERAALAAGIKESSPLDQDVVVDTWFHVIANSTRPEDGYLTDEQLDSQLDAMNEAYADTGFQFRKAGYTKRENPEWAMAGTSAQEEFKPALREGDWKTLNIYFLTRFRSGTDSPGGNCPNPTNEDHDGIALALDGCTIHHATIPGGGASTIHGSMDMGKTAVHEIGHWLGLWHTFENHGDTVFGGCEPGDYVEDTPPERWESFECVQKDTCRSHEGLDPYKNYMDYSPDDCMSEFTRGQSVRMANTWRDFRANEHAN